MTAIRKAVAEDRKFGVGAVLVVAIDSEWHSILDSRVVKHALVSRPCSGVSQIVVLSVPSEIQRLSLCTKHEHLQHLWYGWSSVRQAQWPVTATQSRSGILVEGTSQRMAIGHGPDPD